MSEFLIEFWNISKEAAPYLLLGFFLAGIIKMFLKDSFIQKHLGKDDKASVIKAALFGIPLPLCSCGVVPTAISLNKQGAGKGATTAFLVSTPESGVDSIAITYALMDPIMTIIRPVAAFISAVFAGFFENQFHHEEKPQYESIPHCCSTDGETEHSQDQNSEHVKSTSFISQLKAGLRYSFVDLMSDISLHLLIGLGLAATITFLLPNDFFAAYLSNEFFGMLVMLLIGIPMYICAAASTPIAAALILKGLSPGAALVFLMAGPATNIASLTVLQKALGKSTILRYLISIIVFSFAFGILTNQIYNWFDVVPTAMVMDHQQGLNWLGSTSAIILFFMIAYGIWNENLKSKFNSPQTAHAK